MMEENVHRKQVKHLDGHGHARELTFSCYRRLPLLRPVETCAMLAESLERACLRHEVRLLAYVFMPEHVHLLVLPTQDEMRMQDFLYAVKRPMSSRAKVFFWDKHPEFCRRHLFVQERPGKESFRFWQKGPGYDRNLMSRKSIGAAMEYIHANPVRRGLCEYVDQWQWSSWQAYYKPDGEVVPPKVHTDWML